MDGEFNVFDEWGNRVGKFTPSGSGVGDAVFMMIAMLILWTIGFLIFYLIKLIENGFKAAKEENWEKAIEYWAIPILLIFILVVRLISGVLSTAAGGYQQKKEEARWEEITVPFEHIRAQASRSGLEKELWLLINSPNDVFSAQRIEGSQYIDRSCDEEACDVYGKYEVTNLSWFSIMEISSKCEAEADIYNSELYDPDHPLYPKGTRTISCLEYHLDDASRNAWTNLRGDRGFWREEEICIGISLENPMGEKKINECFELPLKDIDLSSKAHFSIERTPTISVDYSGLLKLTIEIDKTVLYTVAISKIKSEPEARDFHGLFQENENDKRLLDFSPSGFSPGQIYERYIYLYKGFNPRQFCFELSVAYAQNEIVCVNVP